MIDPERLFLWSMSDLEACTRATLLYHTMRIPGLVRLLLTDNPRNGVPLADQLTARYGGAIMFEIAGVTMNAPPPRSGFLPEFLQLRNPFDPQSPFASGMPKRSVSLAELLSFAPLCVNDELISVGHALDHVAYVAGLTHAGTVVRKRPDRTMLMLRRMKVPGGQRDPVLGVVTEAGRIIHRGLLPLLDVIEQAGKLPAGPPPRFDYEPFEAKVRNPDGSWAIQAYGNAYRVSTGVHSEGDPAPSDDAILPGASYMQYEAAGKVWRAYENPGVVADIDGWSIDHILAILGSNGVLLGHAKGSD